jgi:DNA mismatch endonuclease (patch repair protein)
MTRAEIAQEQDDAAGGRAARVVRLPDGHEATAYVALKRGNRRVYATLRYWHNGGTTDKYLCEAPGATRAERLRHAWNFAREHGLVSD